jgi:hypothetical protein
VCFASFSAAYTSRSVVAPARLAAVAVYAHIQKNEYCRHALTIEALTEAFRRLAADRCVVGTVSLILMF